jgi:hypothetical protein
MRKSVEGFIEVGKGKPFEWFAITGCLAMMP